MPRLSARDENELIAAIRKVIDCKYSDFDNKEIDDIINEVVYQVEGNMRYYRRDRLNRHDLDDVPRRVSDKAAKLRVAQRDDRRAEPRRDHHGFGHGNGHGHGHGARRPPPQDRHRDYRRHDDRRDNGHGHGHGARHPPPQDRHRDHRRHDDRRDIGGAPEHKRQRLDAPPLDSALVGVPSAGPQRPTRVKTNFATLHVDPSLHVSQYDVKFEPAVKTADGRLELVDEIGPVALLGHASGAAWAYNGDLILYASAPLALGEAAEAAGWAAADGHTAEKPSFTREAFEGTRRAVRVTISLAGTLTYGRMAEGVCSRDALSALDVAFKQYSTATFRSVGQGFYDESGTRPWAKVEPLPGGGMYQMWQGKRHSIVMTAKGPMLQIDRTVTAMLAPLNLVDFVAKMVKRDPGQLRLDDCKRPASALRRAPKKWKIRASHAKRTWTLRGIDSVPCSESTFEDETGRTLSVATYFEERHKISLRRPDLPCLLVGPAKDPAKLRLPMELCKFVACQPAPVTAEVQAEQIKITSVSVSKRVDAIHRIHRDLLDEHERDDTLRGFGTSMSASLAQAGAVVMEPPVLQYRDPRGALIEVRANAQKGEWNLRNPNPRDQGDLQFIEGARNDGGFVVAKFDRVDDQTVERFTSNLEGMARKRGMDLGRRLGRVLDGCGCDVVAFLDSNVKMLEQREGARVGWVLCVIGSNVAQNAKELYPAIKRWSHTIAHIPTQCVQGGPGKAMGRLLTSPQYHAGVLLKLNLKLGGANGILPAAKGGLALLREEPTMVMGYDINHPQPGSTKPSYAALVAMMDTECTKTFTAVGAQRSREEIAGFVDKVRACLRAFAGANQVAPKRILFYRDGVAHNQFDELLRVECRQIDEACALEQMPPPKLTVVVVQQRTKARFAKEDDTQVQAGTVVNRDIVGADGKDWYMVSQHGLKGTARPCHYHIIHDDTATDPAVLQRLTFELCHLYARATKIVSRPAPVYYAHRAAFLAQYYKDDYKEENMFEVGSTTSNGSGNSTASSIQEIKLGANIANTVYFA